MEEKKTNLGIGALVLLFSGIVCKFLGAFFRLPLTNLLGLEGIGIFQLTMSLYAFCLVVTCGGVTTSLSKLISSARAKDQKEKIKSFLHRAILIGFLIGLCLGLVFFLIWKNLSNLQGTDGNKSYMFFLVLLPIGSLIAVFRGYFQGYEKMLPTAVSQIVEQVTKFLFGLLFAYIFSKDGVENGVFGAFLGIVLSECLTLGLLFVWYSLKKEKLPVFHDDKPAWKEFDKANFLLMISAVIIPLANAFDGLIIVPRLVQSGLQNGAATRLFGLQSGVVGAVLNFPLVISISITTSMLPNLSYFLSKGKMKKGLIEKGLRFVLLSILPATFGIVAISKTLLPLFYTTIDDSLIETAFQLMLYGGFSIVLTAIMQYFVMLLEACGEFRFVLLLTSIGGALKALVTLLLAAVPAINIFALVLGNVLLASTVAFFAVLKLKKKIGFQLKITEVALLLFATSSMFFAVYSFLKCDYFGDLTNLLLAVLIGVTVYSIFVVPILLKIFSKKRRFSV